jgi:glycerol-1-phosphate dehydrogenase [NAD(P)+]
MQSLSRQRWRPPALSTCTCGGRHQPADMPPVWLGPGVMQLAPGILQGLYGTGPLLVVADAGTAHIAESLCRSHSGCSLHLFPGRAEANQANVNALSQRLGCGGFAAMVAVGSGAITDIVRRSSHHARLPFVSVATAASMDGYLSTGAPIVVDGYKHTYPAHSPAAVLADTDVLTKAPARLTLAGLGDVLGKYTALADWLLSHLFTGEPWCPALHESVGHALEQCRQLAATVGSHPSAQAATIMDALLVTGYAMACTCNSRPASGSEHHISHYWEMRALATGDHEYRLHGAQVGVASVLAAAIYHKLLAMPQLAYSASQWEQRQLRLTDAASRRQRLEQEFGQAAARVWQETEGRDGVIFGALGYAEINRRWRACRDAIHGHVPTPPELAAALRSAGAPATPVELGLPLSWAVDGLLYARELRSKFTILDVAAASGCLEELAAQVAHESLQW